jgi:hypothetical protein
VRRRTCWSDERLHPSSLAGSRTGMLFAAWPDVNQRQHMADVVGIRLPLLVLLMFSPIRSSAALPRLAAAVREPMRDPDQKPGTIAEV